MWFLSVECLLCSATKELSVASKEISPCAVPLLLFGPRLLAICCCVYTRQRTTVARETFPWTSTQTWRDLPLNSFIHACGFALECRSMYKYSLVSFCMDYTDGKHLRFRFFFLVVSVSNCSTTSSHTLCLTKCCQFLIWSHSLLVIMVIWR